LWHPKHKLVAPKDFYLDQNTIPLTLLSHLLYLDIICGTIPTYYSAQYNCHLEKKWDISLGPRDISQDNRNKTSFMLLYYSYSRPLREARGNHCHTFIGTSAAAAPPPPPIASNRFPLPAARRCTPPPHTAVARRTPHAARRRHTPPSTVLLPPPADVPANADRL
jgi:hypothetical protein